MYVVISELLIALSLEPGEIAGHFAHDVAVVVGHPRRLARATRWYASCSRFSGPCLGVEKCEVVLLIRSADGQEFEA